MMYTFTMNHQDYFSLAGEEAKKALCLRDKCGAVIVLDGDIVGRGYNAPPGDDVSERRCHLELTYSDKPKSDRTCCMHAEWRAILDAVANGKAKGSALYFVRVDTLGNLKYSNGVPYCTVCSRLALDTGIAFFALYTKEGGKVWDTKKYNDLSYEFHEKRNSS
jgi:deoxycytidylate deaminase